MSDSSSTLKCQMPECDGDLVSAMPIPLQTGCHSYTACYPCAKCGRVHSSTGALMYSRPGAAVYKGPMGLEHVMEPVDLKVGTTYITTSWLYVSLGEEDDGVPALTDLEMGTSLVFDGMEGDMFRFHDIKETSYFLNRADVNCVEAAN